MSLPTLTPASTLSAIVLPVTGNLSNVNSAVPYKIYSNESAPMYSGEFISGAVDQVSFVYKKLGGDVLDIELLLSAWAFIIRSMLALHPKEPVDIQHGESVNLLVIITFSSLSPIVSLM